MTSTLISKEDARTFQKVLALIEDNKFKIAEKKLKPLISNGSSLAMTLYLQGLCHEGQKNLASAAELFEQAISYDSKHEFAFGALAKVLLKQDKDKNKYDASTLLAAEYNLHKRIDSLESLIRVTTELKDWKALAKQSQLLLETEPQNPTALVGLAIATLEQGIAKVPINVEIIESSLKLFMVVLKIQPGFWLIHKAFAKALSALGEQEMAETHYLKSYELNNQDVESLMAAGLCRICLKEFDNSWAMTQQRDKFGAERYGMDRGNYSLCPAPLWQGQFDENKHILVSSEQGIGDQLVFLQLVSELQQQGLRVTMTCNPKLEPILKRSLPNIEFYSDKAEIPSDKLKQMDYKATLFDIAQYQRPSFASFNSPFPQQNITADPILKAQFKQRYHQLFGDKIRIGISWKSLTIEQATLKSTILEHWINILRLPGAQFINVQYGDCNAELNAVCNQYNIDIYQDDFDPFDDTESALAQLDNLDLLLSVSNSSVHMAGRLGIPTFVLLPVSPLWHWFKEGDSSVWYDSVELVRQDLPGVWSNALITLEDKVKSFIEDKQQAQNTH